VTATLETSYSAPYIASLGASAIAAQKLHCAPPSHLLPTTNFIFTLALDVGAPGAVASPMAQPNAEPVEDYECVAALPCRRSAKGYTAKDTGVLIWLQL
jgi:hypothetical protein